MQLTYNLRDSLDVARLKLALWRYDYNIVRSHSAFLRLRTVPHAIGEDVSERLDIIPAQFRVIVTPRPKYACRSCEGGITQAPAPARIFPGGMPTEATLAHILVFKYADYLPPYRQVQIYSRQGIDLDRSTLAAWLGKSAFELTPVYDVLMAELKRSTKLFMGETTAPVLAPESKRTKTGRFWALARDDRL